jgi:hypothetical protein
MFVPASLVNFDLPAAELEVPRSCLEPGEHCSSSGSGAGGGRVPGVVIQPDRLETKQ